MVTIGDRLKTIREEKKLKQKDLAEILNITREAYALYESNKNKPPIDALIKIANFYKVSLDYLTGRYE